MGATVRCARYPLVHDGDLPSAPRVARPTRFRSRAILHSQSLRRRPEPTSRCAPPQHLERLSAWATARGTECALGMAARSRALPSAAPETEAH
jgi:hypothetical protein